MFTLSHAGEKDGEPRNQVPEHMDDDHDEWKVTEYFCHQFCRPEHGFHICSSREDKCNECEFMSESCDDIKYHITSTQMKIKCTFCDLTDSSWRKLKKHFEINHMEPYEN